MSRLLIQFSHLFKSFGSFPLFEDISLSINEGELFALIGENGAGKTTLLQLLAGTSQPDSGSFNRTSTLSIGFLPQEIALSNSSALVREFIEGGSLSDLEREMAACLEDRSRLAEWAELHEKYEQLGGYRRIPIEQVLRGLKLESSLLDLPMSRLSSGQRVRAALAKALIENPDLLFLDEPTNHLDREMLEWLEEALKQRRGACVIVSHDRKFLNAVCNRLVEIKNGKLASYGGSYDFYLAEQERMLERQMKAFEAQEEERAILKQKIKAITFSKGKPTPPKDRNIMAYDRRGEKHQKSLQHKLDAMKARLEEIEANLLSHPKAKKHQGAQICRIALGFFYCNRIGSCRQGIRKQSLAFRFLQEHLQGGENPCHRPERLRKNHTPQSHCRNYFIGRRLHPVDAYNENRFPGPGSRAAAYGSNTSSIFRKPVPHGRRNLKARTA